MDLQKFKQSYLKILNEDIQTEASVETESNKLDNLLDESNTHGENLSKSLINLVKVYDKLDSNEKDKYVEEIKNLFLHIKVMYEDALSQFKEITTSLDYYDEQKMEEEITNQSNIKYTLKDFLTGLDKLKNTKNGIYTLLYMSLDLVDKLAPLTTETNVVLSYIGTDGTRKKLTISADKDNNLRKHLIQILSTVVKIINGIDDEWLYDSDGDMGNLINDLASKIDEKLPENFDVLSQLLKDKYDKVFG